MMLRRLGKWALIALAGALLLGSVAVVTSLAQGPAPASTPQAACPMGGGMGMRFGGMLQTLADALNMKVDALVEALRSGKTVADLAKAQNVTIEQIVDKMIAAHKPALQQAVDAGRITQEQMDAILSRMRTHMTENLPGGACTPGLGQGQGRGAGCGMMGAEGHGAGCGMMGAEGSGAGCGMMGAEGRGAGCGMMGAEGSSAGCGMMGAQNGNASFRPMRGLGRGRSL